MKKLLIALLFAPLTAVAFQGRVDVKLPLKLEVTDGVNVITKGTYNFEMSQDEKSLEFEVHLPVGSDPKFTITNIRPFPYDGPFTVPSDLNGQKYDAEGFMRTFISYSNPMWERQLCQVQIPRQVCHILPNGMKECWWEYQWVTGSQDHQYRFHEEDRNIMMKLQYPNIGTVAAEFQGNEHYSAKETLYVGPCRF